MIIWDGALFLIFSLLFVKCEIFKGAANINAIMKGVSIVLSPILGTFLIVIIGKILMFDLISWFPSIKSTIKFITQKYKSDS